MADCDFEYFAQRADEERRLSVISKDPIAAAIHRRLSILYRKRASTLAGEPFLVPMPVSGRLPA